ncbi:MAG TPA: response regulator [Terriglobales bacterium]
MSTAPPATSRDRAPLTTPLKILLVDDNPDNLLSLEAALLPLAQEIVLARSGKEALRRILQDDFAAILLDVRMPEMDGFETAQIIRSRARSRTTPILFLTAYGGEEPLYRGYGLGAVDFLYKPIIPEILRSKVAVFVELARNADELRRDAIVMRKQEQRFRSLLEAAPDSMVICRADGAIAIVNSKTEDLFRYSRRELLERDIRILIRDWGYEVAAHGHEHTNEETPTWPVANLEIVATHRNGTAFPVEINMSPLQTDEGLMIINAIRDISERVRVEEQRRRAEDQLNILNLRLRALSANVQSAREKEAARIAREIHDELGSLLTTLKWDLEAVDKMLPGADTLLQVSTLRDKIRGMMIITDTTVNTVRRIAADLRPTILDDLGLLEAVEWQAQQFQTRTGILCRYNSSLERAALNRDQSTAVFRIFQEALTNILRHAKAKTVEIVIRELGGEFVLVVQDDGRGMRTDENSAHSSIGILGMQERAHLVGGNVGIAPGHGGGTTVTVRIPICDGL